MFPRPLYTAAADENGTSAEAPLPLSKAVKLFASKPSVATLWRWMSSGVPGPNGDRVYLRYVMFGRRRFIEPLSAREFIAACNARPHVPSVASRPGDSSRALEKLGC